MATTKDAPNVQLDFVEIVAPRLWMSTSYQTTYLTSGPTSAFDVASPDTNYFDCGTIESVRVPLTKEVHKYKQGLPKTARKSWELDRESQVVFNTANLSPYVEALINGNSVFNTVTTGPKHSKVASVMGRDDGRKVTKVASPCGFSQYDIVVIGSPTVAAISGCFNLAVVESFTASILTLESAGVPVTIGGGDQVQKVERVEFIDSMGADTIRSAILFWDVKISSSTPKIQYAMWFPKLRNYTGNDMDTKDSAEPYAESITLEAEAVNMTYDDSTTGYNLYKKWALNYV